MDGRSLDDALGAHCAGLNAADGALAAAMSYGVLRDWRLLNALLDGMVKRRPPALAAALLCVGLFQLRSLRVPAHAAVHATVAAAPVLKLKGLRGLINALLRRYQREAEALEAGVPANPQVRYSHPGWLGRAIEQDWPGRGPDLLDRNNRQAPMTLRVNRRRTTVSAYLEVLSKASIQAMPVPGVPDAVTLAQPMAVDRLPGFAAGDVSVQDAAAQLAAPLLASGPGMRVLDACAAPGGKTAHLLEMQDCRVTALDISPARCESLQATLDRLGLQADVRAADATTPENWWSCEPFDRILVDAPCTGTGVIRRHPDIKWLRRADDVTALADRQQALLRALWPLLEPGGVLLYATCSLLQAEGSTVAASFLAACPDAAELPISDTGWGEADTHGRRIAPGERDMDGFYYVRLRKRSAGD